jgi:hypothetical protein
MGQAVAGPSLAKENTLQETQLDYNGPPGAPRTGLLPRPAIRVPFL